MKIFSSYETKRSFENLTSKKLENYFIQYPIYHLINEEN